MTVARKSGLRLEPKHDIRTRAKIQTTQIINRLHDCVNGKVVLSSAQVKSAEILLRKTLPDLANITLSSDADNPLKTVIELSFRSGV